MAELDPAPRRRAQLPSLNGARFLAVFHIFVLHIIVASQTGAIRFNLINDSLPEDLLYGLVTPWSTNFFVVLSGFVLTYVYANDQGGLRVTSRHFFWLRLSRIAPVYAVSLAIAGPIYFLKEQTATEIVLSTVLALGMLQAWVPDYDYWWNGAAWYFSVMTLTYFLFPSMLRFLQRLRHGTLWLVILMSSLISLAPTIWFLLNDTPAPEAPGLSWMNFLKFFPPLWVPNFAAGIAAALVFLRDESKPTLLQFAAEWATPLVVLICVAIPRTHVLLIRHGLLTPLFALILIGLAHGRGPLTKFLALRAFEPLGEAAFGIFALHLPLMTGLLLLANGGFQPGEWTYGSTPQLFLLLLLIPALAVGSYRFFEKRAIGWVRDRLSNAPKNQPTQSQKV